MIRKMIFSAAALVAALFPAGALAQGPDGSNVNTAIPIAFGQTVTDIVDVTTSPALVYRLALAKGQSITVLTRATSGQNVRWQLLLADSQFKQLGQYTRCDQFLANVCDTSNTAITLTYQVAAAGTYYIVVGAYTRGIGFQLQVNAEGTPFGVPNPPQAGCLTGKVDYITYSLQFIALGLADEISIGGTKACNLAACKTKAPLYPEIVNRIENALRSKVNVEACYDSTGNIFQVKLVTP